MLKGLGKSAIGVILILLLFCACSGTNTVGTENTTAFINGVLIDGTGSAPVSNAEVIVLGNKIVKAGKYNEADVPAAAKIYDLKGATILPGFINAHVHRSYGEENLQNWLNGGVTTVRDEGPMGTGDFLKDRDKFNKNPKNSTIVSATPIITVPGGYGGVNINSPEGARELVSNYIDKKVDIIKTSLEDDLQGRTWNMPTWDEFKSIVDTAHSGNKKVSVHISHVRNLQWAIDAGVDDVAHMVVEPLDSTTISKLVEKNIYWVPTLELWKGVSSMHSLDWDRIAIDNLSKFYQAGGKIALGTDFAGYTCSFDKGFPITEVTLMKEADMTNMDIIVAATKNAAYVCDREKETGTIEAGKKADLLIINGDPLTDINALANTKAVMHNGIIVKE